MQRIVVLNPKGGSGKTTLATNLASHFALAGEQPVLMDYDVQGSSSHWVRKRDASCAHVQLVTVFERNALAMRTFQARVPEGSGCVIIDTPAAIEAHDMPALTRSADKILVPVIVATLRDSQNYVRAAETALGLEEMNAHRVAEDLAQWQPLFEWLGVSSRARRAGSRSA